MLKEVLYGSCCNNEMQQLYDAEVTRDKYVEIGYFAFFSSYNIVGIAGRALEKVTILNANATYQP